MTEVSNRGASHHTGGSEPLELVQALAETLAPTQHVAEVATSVAGALRELVDASAVMLGLHDEQRGLLVPLAATGMSVQTQALLDDPIPIVPGEPSHVVLECGTPRYWSCREERDAQFPRYAAYPTAHESWGVLPLLTRERRVGVLAIGWRERRAFSHDDRTLLGAVAHQCALALDRAVLLEAEREARLNFELLAESMRIMASAVPDTERILRRLVRLAVPAIAPFCAVYVAEDDVLRRVALEVEAETALSGKLREFDVVPITAESPLATAFRTRRPQVVPEVSRALVARIYPDDLADELVGAARSAGGFAALAVPVLSAGRSIGVLSLVSDQWGGAPSDSVLRVAEGLAERAGVALNSAARYQREHETALALTEALLPDTHRVPGLDVASRYLPMGGSVAGDWFDVARAAPDRYVFGVGDAAGHGIRAAALMSELRSAARGLAAAGESPAELLYGLDWLLGQSAGGEFATALYALTDASARRVTWASAGHPPPVHLRRDGPRPLATSGATPLGCPFGPFPRDQAVELGPGEGLVLYTDGLIERRAGRYEARMAGLLEVLAGVLDAGAEEVAQALVESHCEGREDDCSILVLRRPG